MPKGYVYYGGEDGFLPETFTLDQGPVQGFQTSATDPAVGFDGAGVWITDANGNRIAQLTQDGVIMLAAPASSDFVHRVIKWIRGSDLPGLAPVGTIESGIGGYLGSFSGASDYGGVQVFANPGPQQLVVGGGDATVLGRVWAAVNGAGGFPISAGGFGGTVDILDGDGYSSFLHNGNTATAPARPKPMKVRIGSAGAVFSASNFTNVTVTHGLGRTPIAILLCPQSSTGLPVLVANVNNAFNSSTFTYVIQTRDASNISATVPVMWATIG